jgi:hypothetical protein
VAVAELAYFHLLQLSRGAKLPAFNAADSVEDRRRFGEKIEEMVAKRQLPPGASGRREPRDTPGPKAKKKPDKDQ